MSMSPTNGIESQTRGDLIFEYETKYSENYESKDGFYPVFLGTTRFEQTLIYLPIEFLEEIPPWTILTFKFKNRVSEEQTPL